MGLKDDTIVTAAKRSLRKTLETNRVQKAKAKTVIKKTIPKLRRVAKQTRQTVSDLSSGEKRVATDLKTVETILKAKPTAAMEAYAKQRKQQRKPPTKDEQKQIAKLNKALRDAEKYSKIFHQRAMIASDTTVNVDKRIQLLKEMENTLLQQESAGTRLKRMLTSPKFWLAFSVVVLTGYALYAVLPQLTGLVAELRNLVAQLGKTIPESLNSAEKLTNSTTYLVTGTVCSALSGALVVTGIGLPIGVGLGAACGLAGVTFFRGGGGRRRVESSSDS
jgi:hypothetical protein